MSQWIRANFKGKPIWAQVDAAGALVVDGGRVPIRYSDKAGTKIYRAGADNVQASADAPRELPEGVSADASGGRKQGSRGSGFGSAGEGYFRLSAFNSRANVEIAMDRISGLRSNF